MTFSAILDVSNLDNLQNKKGLKYTTAWPYNITCLFTNNRTKSSHSSSCGVLYLRFIAQYRLRSVGLTTSRCVSPPASKKSFQSNWWFEKWNWESARHNQAGDIFWNFSCVPKLGWGHFAGLKGHLRQLKRALCVAHVPTGNIYILWHCMQAYGVRAIVFSGHSMTMQSLLTRIEMSVFGKGAERTFFWFEKKSSYTT